MKLWKDHGTKIIGGATAFGGLLTTLDPATITALLTAFLGDRGPGIATLVIGLVTLWRGFKNSKALPPVP